ANTATNAATYAVRATELQVTVTNGVPYAATVPSGRIPDYYQFIVSSNAYQANFETRQANGNVNLYVRRGPPLLLPFNWQYQSSRAGTSDELIAVTTNTVPIPLTPGLWYLAVSNATAAPVSYNVVATELATTPTNALETTITVTSNSLCVTWNSKIGTNYVVEGKTNLTDAAWDTVSVVITATSTTTTYCLPLPLPHHYFRVREATAPVQPAGTVAVKVTLTTNEVCVNWNSQIGTNYIVEGKPDLTTSNWAAVSPTITATTTNSMYCIPLPTTNHFFRVRESTAPVQPAGPVNVKVTVTTNDVCLSWNSQIGASYLVQGKPDLTASNWTGVSPTITAAATNTTYCILLPTTNHFFRVIGLTGPTNVVPAIITLSNAVAVTTTNVPSNGPDYYRFIVSSNAASAVFETFNANGNVDVLVRKGLPVPDAGNFQYASTNGGTTGEQLVVVTNSLPQPLTAGEWYLAVINKGATPVAYTVRATEFAPPEAIVARIIQVSLVGSTICFQWESKIGTNYVLQGKVNANDPQWDAISPTITAVNITTTYCIDRSTSYSIFRVIEGAASPQFGQTIQ
ncbi:MAG: hypothetical protein DME26_14865, partial [Verrucomicrobia bacterium]